MMRIRVCCAFSVLLFVLLFLSVSDAVAETVLRSDSIGFGEGDSLVRKSVYPPSAADKSNFYNMLWGEHYRKLYSIPITVPAVSLQTLWGGMKVVEQAADFQGLFLEKYVSGPVYRRCLYDH